MAINLYERKSKTKFILALFAALIVVASLYYTSILSTRIANNEQKQVQIWAQAVEQRVQIVERTRNLYEQLAEEERDRVKLWAAATQKILNDPGADVDPIFSDIFFSIEGLPRILVNENEEISGVQDLHDTVTYRPGIVFTDSLRMQFTDYDPIRMETDFTRQMIYYQDSDLFRAIKEEIKKVVNSFISEVVLNSASVPVIYADSSGQVIEYGNLDSSKVAEPGYLVEQIEIMKGQNEPIEIELEEGVVNYIYYKDSLLLQQIKYYPYVQLGVIAFFLLVAYYAFSNARKAEQNQVWVGMSKETAHQLGTPISSLVGWVEYFREQDISPQVIEELEKDIGRLELITERFSKIGSKPDLHPQPIGPVLQEAVDYLKKRASKQVVFSLEMDQRPLHAQINPPLFNWVIENLVKNALDAMEGRGQITIAVSQQGDKLAIDFSDTGKGIPKSRFQSVFQPGYSTKKRGWGLGLSLTKRIIENYHKGKIFVKSSVIGKGTTFRILLPM